MAYSVNNSQSTLGYKFSFALYWGPQELFPLNNFFFRNINLILSYIKSYKIIPEFCLKFYNPEILYFYI
jgi:hypothetical protein